MAEGKPPRSNVGDKTLAFPCAAGDQTDRLAGCSGAQDIGRIQILNAAAGNVSRLQSNAKRLVANDRQLAGDIDAAEVIAGIGFGQPARLGAPHRIREARTLSHAVEYEVAGSIEDARNAAERALISQSSHRLQNRNSATDRSRESKLDLLGSRQGRQLCSLLGDDGLVGSHDVTALP